MNTQEQQRQAIGFAAVSQKDLYNKSLRELITLMHELSGGYYEPKSERDKELAGDISKIVDKHLGM